MMSKTSFKTISISNMALVESVDEASLRAGLTISSTIGRPFTIHLYQENHIGLFIPRALIPPQEYKKKFIEIEWERIYPKWNITLRPEQEKLGRVYTNSLLGDTPFGGIIKAPTGTGKTVLGIHLAMSLGLKTLVIVPTDLILKNWIAELKTFSNLRDKDIGIVRQSQLDYHKPVTLAMIHTLVRPKDFPASFNSSFGHVIFDEVHTLGAETFSRVAPMFHCKYRTGFSATPRRKDGMGNVFTYHIGPLVASHDKADVTPTVIQVEYYNPETHHRGCIWNGSLNIGRYTNKVAGNSHRNHILAKYIAGAFEKNHEILFLSDRIEHLNVIKNILMAAYAIPSQDIGLITATIKQTDRKIRLATYGSAGMGMNIPKLSCLVLGTPRADIEQAVGRILRKKEEDRKAVVVDFVDVSSHIMKGWSGARMKFYHRVGAKVQTVQEDVALHGN